MTFNQNDFPTRRAVCPIGRFIESRLNPRYFESDVTNVDVTNNDVTNVDVTNNDVTNNDVTNND